MGKILTPNQIKMEECMADINKILNQYGFTFQPYFTFIGGQMAQGVNLIPKDITPIELDRQMQAASKGGNGGG